MVQSILEQAPPRFALAGHSMGGWLCLEVFKADPSRVIQLCLLNTTSREDSNEKDQRRREMIDSVEKGEFESIVAKIVDRFVFNSIVKAEVEQMFLAVGAQAFINQQKEMIGRKKCLSILTSISCPTWVIHSREDRNFSLEEHQELVQRIQGAKLAVIEDSGHMSPMEMPQAVTALLRLWLTNP